MPTFANRHLLPLLDGLLLLVMGLAGLIALLTLLDATIGGTIDAFPAGVPASQLQDVLPRGVEVESAVATVSTETGLGYRLLWWLVGPAGSLFLLWGAQVLRDVVRTARDSDPFVAANVRRLRILAALSLGYLVLAAARPLAAIVIRRHLGVDATDIEVPWVAQVLPPALFALSQIWQRGVDLRDEQQLTV